VRLALALGALLLASACTAPPARPDWLAVAIQVEGPAKKESLRDLWVRVTLRNAGDGPIVLLRPMLGRNLVQYDLSLTDETRETRTAGFADSTLAGDLALERGDCFTLEPGAGVQFNVVRHLVVGFTTGFPIAFHDFGNNNRSFTAVDVDFMGVVGLRL